MEEKNCPKCGRKMRYGAPHADNSILNLECECGYCEAVYSETED